MAKNRKKKAITVDFTGVQSSGAMLPEMEGVVLKIVEVTFKDNDDEGAFLWKCEVVDAPKEKFIGKTTTFFTNLQSQSLWVLRNLLDALGIDVPDGPMDIEVEELIDMEFKADIEHREWDGKTRQNITNFEGVEGPEEGKKKKSDEDDVKVSDRKKGRSEDDDEEESKSRKKRRGNDDEEEEPKSKKRGKSDEEDEEPKKGKKKSDEDDEPKKGKNKSESYNEEEIRDMDEKELKSIIKKHDLDVDLDDYSSLRKMCIAVADALEDAGLLEKEGD